MFEVMVGSGESTVAKQRSKSGRIVRLAVALASLVLFSGPDTNPVQAEFDFFEASKTVVEYQFATGEDRDFDRLPDDWLRRKGSRFPHYVDFRIDRETGAQKTGESLRATCNGGNAAFYSPAISISPRHTYVVEGWIRTEGLVNDAGLVTLSLLNARRERVQRLESVAVTGTHRNWVRIQFPRLSPGDDIQFLVIGCHLIAGEIADLEGKVWFDGLRVGRLPRMDLVSNFQAHYIHRDAPVTVRVEVSGLAAPEGLDGIPMAIADELDLMLSTRQGGEIARKTFPLQSQSDSESVQEVRWELPPQEYGHYEATATLRRGDDVLLTQHAMLGVLDLITEPRSGEFGWSFGALHRLPPMVEMPEVLMQGAVNWLAIPVWRPVFDRHSRNAQALRTLVDEGRGRNVQAIGMLLHPPDHLRAKFSSDWTGIADIFEMSPEFWRQDVTPVQTRFASSVDYWQLGNDDSFDGRGDIAELMSRVQKVFSYTGKRSRVVVPWGTSPITNPSGMRTPGFVMIQDDITWTDQERSEHLKKSRSMRKARGLSFQPLPDDAGTLNERTSDLVRRMVLAKLEDLGVIMISDVFHKESGLLNLDGSPRELFLPWRTAALELRGSQPMGRFQLDSGTHVVAFERDGKGIIAIWNEDQVTETIPLGPAIEVTNAWGYSYRPKFDDDDQAMIPVGPVPQFIRNVSPGLIRFRLSTRFGLGEIISMHGSHPDRLLIKNPFPQGISGTIAITPPSGWEIEPRTISFQMGREGAMNVPVQIELPANVSLGLHRMKLKVELNADRKYQMNLVRDYKISSPDLQLRTKTRWLGEDRIEIEQILTNATTPEQVMNFTCYLFAPGQRRQKQLVTSLESGTDSRFYYLSNARALIGKEIWLRVEQTDGRRVLNLKWKVQPPDAGEFSARRLGAPPLR